MKVTDYFPRGENIGKKELNHSGEHWLAKRGAFEQSKPSNPLRHFDLLLFIFQYVDQRAG